MRIRLIICAATLALAAGACGSDDAKTVTEPAGADTGSSESLQQDAGGTTSAESSTSSEVAPDIDVAQSDDATNGAVDTGDSAVADDSVAASPAQAGFGDVPDLEMINLHTDEAISLQSVVDGQAPLLFWFFAPH